MSEQDGELHDITLLLSRVSAGDIAAESLLAEAVYGRMRVAARGIMGKTHGDVTIQATGLVNVVLLELIRLRSVDWKDRDHFFRTAARMLRRRFIDYIRLRRASKRPPSSEGDVLDECLLPTEERFDEILDVANGLDDLAIFDKDLAELVEMVYFGGCPIRTAAEIRGVSAKTISRHLDLAQSWLKIRFSRPPMLANSASNSEQ